MIAPPTLSGRTRILVNTLTAALVLRLLHLEFHSLWVDEGVTWWNATQGGWKDTLFAESNHPPVWWLVTRAWLVVFRGDEFALRAPAAVCGLLAVFLAYRLAVRLSDGARVPTRGGFVGGDGTTALWVVALAAVNPFWIEYAQEARMYSALLAETLGLSLLYLRWLDGQRRGTLVAYALLASLSLHTNYFAVWPIAGHAVHALLVAREARRRGEPLVAPMPLLLAQAAAGLSFVPWFLVMLHGYRGISPGQYEPFGRLAHALWRMGVGPAIVPLDAERVREGPAAVFREEPMVVVLSALAWIVPIALGVRALRRDRGAARFVGVSVLVPLVLVMAACVKWPLVHEKYLIFLAPFLLYLAVVGARSAPGLLRPVLLGGLVTLHVVGLFAYHFPEIPVIERNLGAGHVYGKEQWRSAHFYVREHARFGDVVLLHAPFTRTVWHFYEEHPAHDARGEAATPAPVPATVVPPLDLPSDAELSASELLQRVPKLREAKAVFLVTSHPSTDDPDHYRKVVLEALQEAWGGWQIVLQRELPTQWGITVLHLARP